MNHKLIKELKDAGFPQKRIEYNCQYCEPAFGPREQPDVYIPNLSELIEACMNRVGRFHLKNVNTPRADAWYASKIIEHVGQFIGNGATPEEAVARLFIALHKNV